MAEFSRLYITRNGQNLIARILTGLNIEFTKISLSSKQYNENQLENLTTLGEIKQTANIDNVETTSNNTIKVEANVVNTQVITGYNLHTIGLYAKAPNESEILYAVCIETSGYCFIPAYDGTTVSSTHIQLYTSVGNADNISIEVDTGTYATLNANGVIPKEQLPIRWQKLTYDNRNVFVTPNEEITINASNHFEFAFVFQIYEIDVTNSDHKLIINTPVNVFENYEHSAGDEMSLSAVGYSETWGTTYSATILINDSIVKVLDVRINDTNVITNNSGNDKWRLEIYYR